MISDQTLNCSLVIGYVPHLLLQKVSGVSNLCQQKHKTFFLALGKDSHIFFISM
jgi:hypothetical protein